MTDPDWVEAAAMFSEGFCPECRQPLRPLTSEEEVRGATWYRRPAAVCTLCELVLCVAREEHDEPTGQLVGMVWQARRVGPVVDDVLVRRDGA